jgi:hypothetical protein
MKPTDVEPNPSERGHFKRPARRYALWALCIAFFAALSLTVIVRQKSATPTAQWTQNKFLEELRATNMIEGTIVYDAQSPFLQEIHGRYYAAAESGALVPRNFKTRVRLTDKLEDDVLGTGLFVVKQPNTVLLNILYTFLPFLVIGLLIVSPALGVLVLYALNRRPLH